GFSAVLPVRDFGRDRFFGSGGGGPRRAAAGVLSRGRRPRRGEGRAGRLRFAATLRRGRGTGLPRARGRQDLVFGPTYDGGYYL
ncbi:MAG: hypothetical protein AVDCRST_MAG25-912, partial [uncultured Rubrobacteraceae bacterium]